MGGCNSKKSGTGGPNQIQIKLDEGRKHSGSKELGQSYSLDKDVYKLYEGNRSEVWLAPSQFDPTYKVVIKIFHKNKLNGDTTDVAAEYTNLSMLDHPSIVKFFEMYDSKSRVYFVMEHVQGVSLEEKIKQNGSFDERKAANYV